VDKSAAIFVTGHRGLLGRAVVQELQAAGYDHIVTAARAELDLTDAGRTLNFFMDMRPRAVIHLAALVGGIHANKSRPAEFAYQNLAMQTNVIHSAHHSGTETLLYFGSNCMYPSGATQAMAEEQLLQGPVESSNLAYAAAKIAGHVQAQAYHQQYGRNYFTVIPASLYGPHDNYDLEQCHVTPALLRRMHQAKKAGQPEFVVWGTGDPRRELLYVGDAARGVRQLLERWTATSGSAVNLGCGRDWSVRAIAETLKEVVGFKGRLVFDTTKPDGSPRKLLDSQKAEALGFHAATDLPTGLAKTYQWLLEAPQVRGVQPGEL
jgi:GDP-L-fucose synthase